MNRIKRIIPVILITVVLAGILAACGSRSENSGTKKEDEMKGEYHKITAEEAKERMDSGDDIIILDVRTQDEYEESHIPGAILIPNETIARKCRISFRMQVRRSSYTAAAATEAHRPLKSWWKRDTRRSMILEESWTGLMKR